MLASPIFVPFMLALFGSAKEAAGLLTYHHLLHSRHHCGALIVRTQKGHSFNILATAASRGDTEDEQRLLLTEPAVAAFVEAEVRSWLLDDHLRPSFEVEEAAASVSSAAKDAYEEASRDGVLSHHGALITFISSELREGDRGASSTSDEGGASKLSHHLQRLRTDPYNVAKRCVDVLHHRLYRGTYTTTVVPTGSGEVAAREAVGLPPADGKSTDGMDVEGASDDDDDNCLVEPPPELSGSDCLWTERDEAAWRTRRFEKITMEGWRDPRRGNSGTSR